MLGFLSILIQFWTTCHALHFLFFYFYFFYSKPRTFRCNSTIEQQCDQWAARILKAALGNVAAGSIQLRRPEVLASTQERRAMYG